MNAEFELACADAAEDILFDFEGMGIPAEGESQRHQLQNELRYAIRAVLAEWCE